MAGYGLPLLLPTFEAEVVDLAGRALPVVRAGAGVLTVVAAPGTEFAVKVTVRDSPHHTHQVHLRLDGTDVGYSKLLYPHAHYSTATFDGFLATAAAPTGGGDASTTYRSFKFARLQPAADAALVDDPDDIRAGRIDLDCFTVVDVGVGMTDPGGVRAVQPGGAADKRLPEGKKFFMAPGLATEAGSAKAKQTHWDLRQWQTVCELAKLTLRYDSADNLQLRRVLNPAVAAHRAILDRARGVKREGGAPAAGGADAVKRERGADVPQSATAVKVDLTGEAPPGPLEIDGRPLEADEAAVCDLCDSDDEPVWRATKKRAVSVEPAPLGADDEAPEPGGGEPGAGSEAPGAGGEEPAARSEEPEAGGEEPAAGSEEPAAGGEEPAARSEAPVAGDGEPDTGGEEPAAHSEEPEAGGEEPAGRSEAPAAGGGEPEPSTEPAAGAGQDDMPPGSGRSMADSPGRAACGQVWLDAWADPVAGLRAFSCVHTCDLLGDGDWRLVVADADKKLKVWRGTAKASEHALLDAPTAVTSFLPPAASPPRMPTLAVAAGPHVYMFRALRPHYRFTLPPADSSPAEDAVWQQVDAGELDAAAGAAQLQQQLDGGAPLGGRSRRLLAAAPEQRAGFAASSRGQAGLSCITCMDVVADSDEPGATSRLVLGTEDCRLLVLNAAGTAVERAVALPAVPAFLATAAGGGGGGGGGDAAGGWRVSVAARDGRLYSVKAGALSRRAVQLDAQPVGVVRAPPRTARAPAHRARRARAARVLPANAAPAPRGVQVRLAKQVVVATMGDALHAYSAKGARLYSLRVPAPVLCLQALPGGGPRPCRCVVAALANGEVRLYNDRALVALHILPRTANLDAAGAGGGGGGGAGPPPEQDVPLDVPRKTRLYVEQCAREREGGVDMHRAFQRDLCKLRLATARACVRALTDGQVRARQRAGGASGHGGAGAGAGARAPRARAAQGAASHAAAAQLSMSAAVQGLGPRFRLVVSLTNEGAELATGLQVVVQGGDAYAVHGPHLLVPALVPALQYDLKVDATCLQPAAGAGALRVVVLGRGGAAPLMSALVRMPLSEPGPDMSHRRAPAAPGRRHAPASALAACLLGLLAASSVSAAAAHGGAVPLRGARRSLLQARPAMAMNPPIVDEERGYSMSASSFGRQGAYGSRPTNSFAWTQAPQGRRGLRQQQQQPRGWGAAPGRGWGQQPLEQQQPLELQQPQQAGAWGAPAAQGVAAPGALGRRGAPGGGQGWGGAAPAGGQGWGGWGAAAPRGAQGWGGQGGRAWRYNRGDRAALDQLTGPQVASYRGVRRQDIPVTGAAAPLAQGIRRRGNARGAADSLARAYTSGQADAAARAVASAATVPGGGAEAAAAAEAVAETATKHPEVASDLLAKSAGYAVTRGQTDRFADTMADAFVVARERRALPQFTSAVAGAISAGGAPTRYAYGQAIAAAIAGGGDGQAAVAEATAQAFCAGGSTASAWASAYAVALGQDAQGCLVLNQAKAMAQAQCGAGAAQAVSKAEATSLVLGFCGLLDFMPGGSFPDFSWSGGNSGSTSTDGGLGAAQGAGRA
ncbi:Bbs1 [Scenedesmus sp. PABB004]|nr:Bbs1 [Scenedesmus sp. PABB004]